MEEYDVYFLIKRRKRPAELMVTYVCLSDKHYEVHSSVTKEELIARQGFFILCDTHKFERGMSVTFLKYRPTSHWGALKGEMIKDDVRPC